MALKDILLHLDNSPRSEARLDLAVGLARSHGAHLKGVYILSHPFYSPHQQEGEDSEGWRVKAMFEEKAAAAGIRSEWLYVDWTVVGVTVTEILTIYAQYADLVIVGQPDLTGNDRHSTLVVPERLGLGAGRPMLVVPYAGAFPTSRERVMVAWKAGRESVRAVNDAMAFLKKGSHVSVVSVCTSELPDNAVETAGRRICDHLAHHEVKAVHEQLLAPAGFPVGDLLLNHACEQKMDLLVMGGYAQTRRGAYMFGPVAKHLLSHMTLPVLLSH